MTPGGTDALSEVQIEACLKVYGRDVCGMIAQKDIGEESREAPLVIGDERDACCSN